MENYEIHKYNGLKNPPDIVKAQIATLEKAVESHDYFVTNNPEYQYRIVKVLTHFHKSGELK